MLGTYLSGVFGRFVVEEVWVKDRVNRAVGGVGRKQIPLEADRGSVGGRGGCLCVVEEGIVILVGASLDIEQCTRGDLRGGEGVLLLRRKVCLGMYLSAWQSMLGEGFGGGMSVGLVRNWGGEGSDSRPTP